MCISFIMQKTDVHFGGIAFRS